MRSPLLFLAALAVAAATQAPLLRKESVRASATGLWSRGDRAPRDKVLEMTFAVKQRNTDVLERELLAVSDPTSSRYGQHLSREQVDAIVAPAPESLRAVYEWLHAYGITPVALNGAADFLGANVTVEVAEQLLGTEYFVYTQLGSAARVHSIVRVGEEGYSLPASVHGHLDFVAPTTRFPQLQRTRLSMPSLANVRLRGSGPVEGSAVTPAGIRSLYSVGNRTGQNPQSRQAVAQFLGQFMAQTDLDSFFESFYPAGKGQAPTILGPNDPTNPGDEASLDIEYIMSIGANISTDFWSTAGEQPHNPENEPFLDWLTTLEAQSDDRIAKVVSVSYGDNEDSVWFDYAVRVNTEFQKVGARGVSIMFSSGDGGVAGSQPSSCSTFIPTFPAASPYVTAVGGTTGFSPEVAAKLSAGGFSNYWARPTWQVSAVAHYFSVATNVPNKALFNQTGAGFPDVAALAENFQIVFRGMTLGVGGTSCASPTFSGIVALLNDLRFAQGKSSLGFLNPFIYQNPQVFNDITAGNNPGCGSNGFTAAAGWDPVTGFGSPNFEKLAAAVTALP